MQAEPRCVERKRPSWISYFEFETGSEGIVLDASEKGLRFQAADAVHQLGPSRIWISPRPEERIEVTGAVVWTDTSRKTGGLRFIETGADSSKKIRYWLGRQDESEVSPSSEGLPLPAWSTQAPGDLWSEDRHSANVRRAMPESRARAKTQVEERPMQLRSIPGLPSLFASSLPWQPQDSSPSDGRIAHGIATGFLIVVLVVAGVVLFQRFRPKVGESLILLGERINGTAKSQPLNTSTQPSSAQATAQTGLADEAKPDAVQTEAIPGAAKKETHKDSALPVDASKQVNTQTSETAIPRQEAPTEETADRPADPGATNSKEARSAEAAQLWSAVASGDSSAEIDLARLYLRGDGVPRNCVQAKVLLRAAAKAGSAKASQQLKKLRSSACR